MTESNAAQDPQQDVGEPTQSAEQNQEARIQDLEMQLANMKTEALRHLADAENTRKRAAKERDDTIKYGVAKFARDLLDVADNLSRALTAKPEGLENNQPLKNLIAGVEATEKQMLAIFDRAGIKKIDPLGQAFDPNLHQVVSEIDAPDKPAGTVVQVLQVGYMIHDRLLREAMVAVAKGGSQAPQSVDQTV